MSQQSSGQAMLNNIREAILNTHHSVDLEFPGIPPDIGLFLTRSFAEDPDIERALPRISFNSQTLTLSARIMSTDVQDCHQGWLARQLRDMVDAGFITSAERNILKLRVGTTYEGFVAPYASSSKEPDICIRPDRSPLPTFVIESGWSESWPRLLADKNLWLAGGPTVEAVLLIRWTKVAGNHIKGDLQLYGRDAARNIALIQAEPIFPAPSAGASQSIPITMRQIFGPSLPLGKNPRETYRLSIENLRAEADDAIRDMGFTPAS